MKRFGEGGEEMSDEITQQTLLPEVKDPNLWMVKCRIGEEKITVMHMMRKVIIFFFFFVIIDQRGRQLTN